MNQKIVRLTIFIFALSGCSSLKDYVSKGAPNFTASFKAEGSFLQSKELDLNIFEYKPNCKVKYLGTIEMDRNETKRIALPVNRAIGVKLVYDHTILWARSETVHASDPFKMVLRKDTRYALDFEVEGGSIGSNFYDVTNGKRQELAPVEFYKNQCKDFEDE